MLLALFGMITRFGLRVTLRRRNVHIEFLQAGMPGYLYQLCLTLPPSEENARLTRLAWWSNFALVIGFIVGAVSGALLVCAQGNAKHSS